MPRLLGTPSQIIASLTWGIWASHLSLCDTAGSTTLYPQQPFRVHGSVLRKLALGNWWQEARAGASLAVGLVVRTTRSLS
jgi:hypothetical protein